MDALAGSLDRRRFLQLLLAGSAGLLAPVRALASPVPVRPPNLLILLPDQHRADVLGCAGDPFARTPHIDRLASEGVRFTRAVSSSPVCSPFRATLQTGQHWFHHGVAQNNVRLPPERTTLGERFSARGYATTYIGKWHLDGLAATRPGAIPPERRRGWQDWMGYEQSNRHLDVFRYDDAGTKLAVEGFEWQPAHETARALDAIRHHQAAGRPWIAMVSWGPPHSPQDCPERLLGEFDARAFRLPPDLAGRLEPEVEKRLRRILRVYYAQVSGIDEEVGRMLRGLDELGAASDTIVVYASDHGDRLGSHGDEMPGSRGFELRGKASPHATSLRIPLIVRWPGRIAPGRVCDALVGSEDLAPTLLDLAGLPVPAEMDGRSMAGWALAGDGPRREWLYLGLREQPGRRFGWRGVWDGRVLFSRGAWRVLYDHAEDPYEQRNRAALPEDAARVAELDSRLASLARQLGDPAAESLGSAVGSPGSG